MHSQRPASVGGGDGCRHGKSSVSLASTAPLQLESSQVTDATGFSLLFRPMSREVFLEPTKIPPTPLSPPRQFCETSRRFESQNDRIDSYGRLKT